MDKAIIYFSKEDKLWTEEEFESACLKMPKLIADKIMEYTDPLTRQLKLTGKLQLQSLINHYNLPLCLDQLRFTNSNRPYLHPDFDFSIAHSNDIVICGGIKNARIGIDIEKIKPLDVNLFENYFSLEEWKIIKGSENYLSTFYRFWTRKEALAKAIGTGVLTELSNYAVIDEKIETQKCNFYLHDLIILKGYIASMAVSIANVTPTIIELDKIYIS